MKFRNVMLAHLLLTLAAGAFAADQKFIVGNNGKQLNSISIESQTDLETIVTTSNAITGEVVWDRDAKTGSAKLTVPVVSLNTGIPDRNEHLQGEGWLNAAKHPNITFEATKIKALDADKYEVTGNFSMAGTTKELTAVATLKYLPHRKELDEIMPNANFAKINTAFELKLSDFGIKFPVIGLKVSDTLKVKITLIGVDEIK